MLVVYGVLGSSNQSLPGRGVIGAVGVIVDDGPVESLIRLECIFGKCEDLFVPDVSDHGDSMISSVDTDRRGIRSKIEIRKLIAIEIGFHGIYGSWRPIRLGFIDDKRILIGNAEDRAGVSCLHIQIDGGTIRILVTGFDSRSAITIILDSKVGDSPAGSFKNLFGIQGIILVPIGEGGKLEVFFSNLPICLQSDRRGFGTSIEERNGMISHVVCHLGLDAVAPGSGITWIGDRSAEEGFVDGRVVPVFVDSNTDKIVCGLLVGSDHLGSVICDAGSGTEAIAGIRKCGLGKIGNLVVPGFAGDSEFTIIVTAVDITGGKVNIRKYLTKVGGHETLGIVIPSTIGGNDEVLKIGSLEIGSFFGILVKSDGNGISVFVFSDAIDAVRGIGERPSDIGHAVQGRLAKVKNPAIPGFSGKFDSFTRLFQGRILGTEIEVWKFMSAEFELHGILDGIAPHSPSVCFSRNIESFDKGESQSCGFVSVSGIHLGSDDTVVRHGLGGNKGSSERIVAGNRYIISGSFIGSLGIVDHGSVEDVAGDGQSFIVSIIIGIESVGSKIDVRDVGTMSVDILVDFLRNGFIESRAVGRNGKRIVIIDVEADKAGSKKNSHNRASVIHLLVGNKRLQTSVGILFFDAGIAGSFENRLGRREDTIVFEAPVDGKLLHFVVPVIGERICSKIEIRKLMSIEAGCETGSDVAWPLSTGRSLVFFLIVAREMREGCAGRSALVDFDADVASVFEGIVSGNDDTIAFRRLLDILVSAGLECSHTVIQNAVVPFSAIDSVKAEIVDEDSLMDDNSMVVYNNSSVSTTNILLVSEKPFYFKSILSAIDRVTDYKNTVTTVTPSYYNTSSSYDLYIFDSFTPESLPKSGTVFFFNSSETLEGTGFTFQKSVEANDAIHLSYSDNTSSQVYQTFTKGIAHNDIVVKKYMRYTLNQDFTTILSYNNLPFVFAGKTENQQRELVFAFDLHDSNLPLLYDFTPLMRNALQYANPKILENFSYEVGDEVTFSLSNNMKSFVITDPDGGKESYQTSDRDFLKYTLEKTGNYQVSIVYQDGKDKKFNLYSRFSAKECVPHEEETDAISLNVDTSIKKGNGIFDNLLPIVICAILFFLADWGVYAYEQY